MKLISFVIPCYNSSQYMSHAIDSILSGGEKVEIIIVNDGSKDNTLKIAKEYEKKYPTIIKVIDKENGGHGSSVNKGLELATGLYFKVVDSDDWVSEQSLQKVLNQIEIFVKEKQEVELLIANYVYEKEGNQRVIRYLNLPQNKIFSWDDIKKFKPGEYLLMHSVFFKTKFLKETKLKLPEHTFYVDNIFVYKPLRKVKNMFYMNTDLYRYFIGREDQSVNESIMLTRIDQQIFVTKTMIEMGSPLKHKLQNPKLCTYELHYLSIMMSICTILLKINNTKEDQKKRKELWNYLKNYDKKLYHQLRWRSVATLTCLPRIIAVPGYHFAKKIYKFN